MNKPAPMQMKFLLSFLIISSLSILSCGNKSKATTTSTDVNIPFVQNISVTDIPDIHNTKPSIKFLDVRTPEEISQGMINGALKIDFRAKDFKKQLEKLNKEESYIVYCKSGGRSSKTADIMQQMGFSSIYNLEGGYTAFAASE